MRAIRLVIVLGLIFTGPQFLNAQPGPPTSGPACWPPPCVPIDGGLVFLIAAGAAYGGKKLIDYKKRSKTLS